MQNPYSGQFISDQEAGLLALRAAQMSLGVRRRRRRFRPLFLVLLLLVASGVVVFRLHSGTPSGLPSPADADGIANFQVGTHPAIVINAADGAINVHTNTVDHG